MKIRNLEGKEVGEHSAPDDLFQKEPNRHAMALVVRAQRAAKRSGTAAVRNRSLVKASSKKLGKQKGGGRARHGSIGAPNFVGGGVVHGPQLRSYAFSVPRRVRGVALESAVATKIASGNLHLVDDFASVSAPKTREVVKAAAALEARLERGLLLVDAKVSEPLALSVRNLPRGNALPVEGVNVYDLLRHKDIAITVAGFEALCERIRRQKRSRKLVAGAAS